MNTKLMRTAEGVIAAAMRQGRTVPALIAEALESARLLQSPETAAELARVRAEMVRLEKGAPPLQTDQLKPGMKVIAKDMTRFTVDSVAPAKVDWRFQGRQSDGSFSSESGMEIVGHDEAGEIVRFTAAQSYKWYRDVEAELATLRARVAELEYVAPSPSCTRCYGADAERFVAQGGVTAACPVCGPSELEQLRARVAELEARLAEYARPADEDPIAYALTDAAEAPYVSRPLPPRHANCAGCGHPGEFHQHGDTKCWAHLPKRHGDPVTVCGCSGFVAEDDVTPQVTKLRALLAGQREQTQAGDR